MTLMPILKCYYPIGTVETLSTVKGRKVPRIRECLLPEGQDESLHHDPRGHVIPLDCDRVGRRINNDILPGLNVAEAPPLVAAFDEHGRDELYKNRSSRKSGSQ